MAGMFFGENADVDVRKQHRAPVHFAQFPPMGTFCKTVVVEDLKKNCVEKVEVSVKHMDLGRR